MKSFVFLTLTLLSFQFAYSQGDNFKIEVNVDTLDLWQYHFEKDTSNQESLGILILERTHDIYSEDSTKKIRPEIEFKIYPVAYYDSISKIESERMFWLSCCFPKCGATIIKSKNYVFWSDPWSITAALECSGVDYTRWNARFIIGKISEQNFNSIEEFIIHLPIKKCPK